MENQGEIILYQPDEEVKLEVRLAPPKAPLEAIIEGGCY